MTNNVQKILPKIVVAGVGGAGGNAVNNMILTGTNGVEFITLNTDAQALANNLAETKIQLGTNLTEGLGAGAKPEVGRNAATETLDDILGHLDSANMVFITAGMGGGTGTGAAPVIAKACRERGILTVGVVTKPFHFEGTHRMKMAEEGIAEMQSYVDTLIVIPNQNLFRVVNEKTTFAEAFKLADGVLQAAVRGVTDLIVNPGVINLDFADIRSVMLEMGKAVMGMGEATGDRRASEAAEKAINNPLLDDVSMKGARGVIVNIAGGYDMTLFEVDEACNRIRDEVDANANIIFGSSFDEKMEGIMRVSVIATGIDAAQMAKTTRAPQSGAFSVERPSQSRMAPAPVARPAVTATTMAPRAPYYAPQPQQQTVVADDYAALQPQVQQQPSVAAQSVPTYAQIAQAGQAMRHVASSAAPQQAPSYETPREAYAEPQLRGARYQGAFIPPQPLESGRDANTAYQNWSGGASAAVAQPSVAQATVQVHVQEDVVVTTQQAAAPSEPRRKSPSLFERITGGIRREIDAVRNTREELSFADDMAQAEAVSSPETQVRASAPVQRKAPELPVQGRLNIDSPAQPSASDSELEIPAFLRRQAN